MGIIIKNNRLDTPIENNYFFYNVYGVVEFGTRHTDISNNLIYHSYYSGIEVYLASEGNAADANSYILIENNTCDYYQDDGITVHGVPSSSNAGTVMLLKNIVAESYQYGMNLVDGYMMAAVACTGYYGNADNKNWDFEESNSVVASSMPFVDGAGYFDICHLNQTCPFINAGLDYVEQTHLIGMTTDVNGIPDSNKTDLGFHHPNWNFTNANSGFATGDFNHDTITDYKDLYVLTSHWLSSVTPGSNGDLNNDGNVTFIDYARFATNWQKTQGEPNITLTISGDSSSGYVDAGVSGFTSDTQRVFVLTDGKYVGEIFGFANGDTFGMDISESDSQQHLKLVGISSTGRVTCSNINNVAFSCPLNYCLVPSSYEPNKPLYFSAYNTGAEDVSVNVYADSGNLVWSQSYSGNSVLGSIPAAITSQHEIDYVSFDTSSGELLGMSGGASITKITDPAEPSFSGDVKALIILPDLGVRLADKKQIWAAQTAFKNKGIKYKKLGVKSATYANIAWYAITNPVKYIYIDAHGHYKLGDALRTCVQLYDGIAVSMKRSDFFNPNSAPSWCGSLGSYWETRAKSFFSMGFYALEFAYFDCCYSGRLKINANNHLVEGQPGQIGLFDGPYSDMSIALGIDEPSKTRVYQGWYDVVPIGSPQQENEYQKWTRLEWEALGDGDNLDLVLLYVIGEQTEFGDDDPVNNYRLKGQGFIWDIFLGND